MPRGATIDSSSKSTAAKSIATKSRARPKAAAKKDTLSLKTQSVAPSPDELSAMIATAAYFCAERREFAPGHELEDWLTAEKEIRLLYQ